MNTPEAAESLPSRPPERPLLAVIEGCNCASEEEGGGLQGVGKTARAKSRRPQLPDHGDWRSVLTKENSRYPQDHGWRFKEVLSLSELVPCLTY